MILIDSETKVDLLNNEAIALTIIEMLRERPDKPVTLGVHGDWGAGKSSILEMIEASLDGKDKILCIKFNGWRFQGFEDAKIALIEGIVTALIEKRPFLTKKTDEVVDVLKRVDVFKLAKRAGGFIWNATTGMPSPDQLQSVIGGLKHLADNPEELADKENLEAAAKSLGGLLKPAEEKRMPEEVEEFRKAFDALLDKAGVEQLIVLVDDLDRCLPDTTIETLEAIRLFVFTKRTAFVIGADEGMIEYAVRKHFPDLPNANGLKNYARNYLEKLIQVPFRIPTLGETETRIYITLLLVGALVGEDDPGFKKLIAESRVRLKKPWASQPLDSDAIESALGDKASSAQDMLALSDQIGPILANGTEGNPRQIKRFLNTLLLRKSIASARGFGSEVELPILAKLMLAERFIPDLFDQIANNAAKSTDGTYGPLAEVEASASNESGAKDSGDGKKPKDKNSEVTDAWLENKEIAEWASLSPKLAEVDLRPYLFVAKDKKNYFGSSSTLGKLTTVIDRLMGKAMAIQTVTGEIKQLSPSEATEVFQALRLNILTKPTYPKRPDGIEGVIALVAEHDHLETRLLDLLDILPTVNLGVWVTGGWNSSIRSLEGKARFKVILQKWEQTDNPMLKSAAQTALGKIV